MIRCRSCLELRPTESDVLGKLTLLHIITYWTLAAVLVHSSKLLYGDILLNVYLPSIRTTEPCELQGTKWVVHATFNSNLDLQISLIFLNTSFTGFSRLSSSIILRSGNRLVH